MMDIQVFYEGLDACFERNDSQTTIRYLKDCLYRCQMDNDYEGIIAVSNELGSFCRALGDLEQAKTLYQQVFDCLKKLDKENTVDYATALINLGVVYVWEQNGKKAIDLFQQAKCILIGHGLGYDYRMAALYNDIAMAYKVIGQIGLAENTLKKAAHIIRQYPKCRAELATTFVNQGKLQISAKSYADAEKSFLSAIHIFEEELNGNDVHYSAACIGMGELLHLRGDLNASVDYYEKALQLIERDFGKTAVYHSVFTELAEIKLKHREKDHMDERA